MSDEGRVSAAPGNTPTGSVRIRPALAAIVQAREALADGDIWFVVASLENAEEELAGFLAEAA